MQRIRFFPTLLKSRFLKDSASYTIINIFDKAIPFLIMPIISRVLSKEEMGYYSLYQVTFQVFIPILTLCLEYPIIINYFKKPPHEFSAYFSTGVALTCVLWTMMAGVCTAFIRPLSVLFGLSPKWLMVTFLIVLLNFMNQLRMTMFQQQGKPEKYGRFSIPFLLTKNLLALFFILVLNYGWEGLILGHLIGQMLFFVVSMASFVKEKLILVSFKVAYISGMLKMSVPVVFHSLSGWMGNSLNRLIINSLIGAVATGSYGIGAVFGTIVTVLGDAVNKAFAPYLFEQLSKYGSNANEKLKGLIMYCYLFFVLLGVVMSVIGYFGVGLVFGSMYLDTRQFVIPIVVSATINDLYRLHVNFLFFAEKTNVIARNTFICALVNVLTAYILTKFMGLFGAACATIVFQLLLYVLTVFYSNNYMRQVESCINTKH